MSREAFDLEDPHAKAYRKTFTDRSRSRRSEARHLAVVEECRAHDLRHILDVGCGDGMLEYHFMEAGLDNGKTLVGFDVSLASVAAARDRCDGEAKFLVADLRTIPFRRGWFDALIAVEVVEHLLHPQHWVGLFAQYLRPGGVLIATLPAFWAKGNTRRALRTMRSFNLYHVEHTWTDGAGVNQFPHRMFWKAGIRRIFRGLEHILKVEEIRRIPKSGNFMVIARRLESSEPAASQRV